MAERLHQHRALGPRALAQDLAPGERHAQRRLHPRAVAGQIRTPAGARPAARRTRRSPPRCRRGRIARGPPRCPPRDGPAPGRSASASPPERGPQRGLDQQLAHRGRSAARIEHRGAARRIQVELASRLGVVEQPMHVLVHGKAVLGVAERRRQHVGQAPGAVRLEDGEVGVDGARHGERQVRIGPRPCRDAIEPAPAEPARWSPAPAPCPDRSRTKVWPRRTSCTRATHSPQSVYDAVGSTTAAAKPHATAASNALPPDSSMRIPAMATRGCPADTTAVRPRDDRTRRRALGRLVLHLVDLPAGSGHRLAPLRERRDVGSPRRPRPVGTRAGYHRNQLMAARSGSNTGEVGASRQA